MPGSALEALLVVPFTLLLYAFTRLATRLAGKRSLAQYTSLDLVLAVAIGALLATPILTPAFPVGRSMLAIATLVAAQMIVAWAMCRWPKVQQWCAGDPTLLVFRGRILEVQLRKVHLTPAQLFAEMRKSGFVALDEVGLAVMETTGQISVIGAEKAGRGVATVEQEAELAKQVGGDTADLPRGEQI